MSDIIRIKQKQILPLDVIEDLNQDAQSIEEIYVITIKNGRPTLRFSGNMAGLSYASVLMSSEVAINVFESEG